MTRHRVDIDVKGTSYYVDNGLRSQTGFPFWKNRLPDGLHRERAVGRSFKYCVRSSKIGKSFEWKRDEGTHRAQGNQNQVRSPPRHPQGRNRGAQREERPVQNRDQQDRQDPGLFDVPDGNSEDGDNHHRDDGHSEANSRGDDSVHARHQDDDVHPGGDDFTDRAVGAQSSDVPTSWEKPPLGKRDHVGDPQGHDSPHRHMKAKWSDPIRLNRQEPPAWPEHRGLRQQKRDHDRHEQRNDDDRAGRAKSTIPAEHRKLHQRERDHDRHRQRNDDDRAERAKSTIPAEHRKLHQRERDHDRHRQRNDNDRAERAKSTIPVGHQGLRQPKRDHDRQGQRNDEDHARRAKSTIPAEHPKLHQRERDHNRYTQKYNEDRAMRAKSTISGVGELRERRHDHDRHTRERDLDHAMRATSTISRSEELRERHRDHDRHTRKRDRDRAIRNAPKFAGLPVIL